VGMCVCVRERLWMCVYVLFILCWSKVSLFSLCKCKLHFLFSILLPAAVFTCFCSNFLFTRI
jgi:hypothetical protein